ncbi:hypothetical protein LINGRAPRIM_LOCUS782 [Linum grandiflorum]
MSSFSSTLQSLAASHVKYTNDHMRSTHHHSLYAKYFLKRTVLPSTRLDISGFSKYGLDPASLIGNLGWEGSLSAGCFSTFVEGYKIFVTPQLLQQVLGVPSGGLPVFNETDFSRVHYSDPRQPSQLPFGPAISFLLTALGIPLGSKFTAESPLTILRPSHALREVGFQLANSVLDSGGVPQSPIQEISLSDDEEDNSLAKKLERSLQIEEALEVAALERDFPSIY